MDTITGALMDAQDAPDAPAAPTMQATPATPAQPGQIPVYPNEDMLFYALSLVAGMILTTLTFFTVGLIWLAMLWGYLGYLCVASYFISHVRGNGVHITARQFPGLHARLLHCCAVAGLAEAPQFYLLAGNGMRNAFAARFLNRDYVVLLSDIVDALEDDTEALNFYIGHELGHIARGHIARGWYLRVAMALPLLGCAYARAREYTCDQYGLACCDDVDSAVHALAVMAAGAQRWKTLHKGAFAEQAAITGGFWMSLNELISDYPWLCKRVARVRCEQPLFPERHPLALLLAFFVPRSGLGLIGAFVMYSYLALAVLMVVIGVAGGGITK
jgi:Zn-dependent protease with chaperone function